ncbi:thiolase-like protein [Hyaloraphidium curvatum]|nr:thiolase-like protein [Hyaloraphidium curvatum]
MPTATARTWAEPIAIVGMACSFPAGCDTPEQYFERMLEAKDIRTGPPNERWNTRIRPESGWKGTFLDKVEHFDPEFFGLKEAESQQLDAQQRIAVQVAHEALANAGYADAATPEGQREGLKSSESAAVYVGVANADGATLGFQLDATPYTLVGVLPFGTANRVSHCLGLKGPSVTMDTGCSSSLYALHQACNALLMGDLEMAVVCGSTVFTNPNMASMLSQVGVLSKRYMTSAFDDAADGYVRGEGCGAVVLKPLSAALRDRDPIVALVRGSALGHNGRSKMIAAPSTDGQIAVIRAALEKAGVDPDDVDFLECHATGTVSGDRKELETVGRVFGERDGKIVLGTVKSMFGHAEGAAGIMGVIKAAMVLRHRLVPPNLNFTALRHDARCDPTKLTVPSVASGPVKLDKDGDLFAGVNSFGAGGTNAHALLQEWRGEGSDRVVFGEFSYPNMRYLPFPCTTHPYFIGAHIRALEAPDEDEEKLAREEEKKMLAAGMALRRPSKILVPPTSHQ